MNKYVVKTTDPIVLALIKALDERSVIGIEKYGNTLCREDINVSGWLQHLQEELMDATLYVERLKSEVANG